MIQNHLLKYWPVLAVILITPLFLMLMVEVVIIPFVEKQIMVQKQQQIRQVVEVAYGIIEDNNKQILHEAHISVAEAQKRAMRTLKGIRYGSKDYFWINDMGKPVPKMIMHPTEPYLDGKLLDDPQFNRATSLRYGLNCPEKNLDNLNLFIAFTEVAEKANHGYVTYYWAKPILDGGITEELYEKLSYVKLFKPWGWVIGSGIYVDDVYKEAAKLRYWVYSATLIFTIFLLFVSYLLNIVKRKRMEQALRETTELFTLLMNSSPIYIFIREVTPDGNRVVQASENFQQMIGIPGSEMVGKTMEELFPADFAAKITADDLAVLSSGDALQFDESFNGHSYTTIKFPIVRGEKSLLAGYSIDITKRKQAEAEIHRLNAELEQRVTERTAQLKAASQEMESFAYSVSHDLRAPLRSIDGFSLALLEDYGEKLDEEGRKNIQRVRAATQRMAQLIDDILKLSRITRSELTFETVELSAMAVSIVNELRTADPERKVEFVINNGMISKGDSHLLKVMLDNLLGNAWKFTSGHAEARIEFGATDVDGKTVYFVRDDGAGFDMKYADKLFTTFQRLHTEQEFPGTGIGLALVQHIIHRHGGTVWAEGAVEKGATFYFTLE